MFVHADAGLLIVMNFLGCHLQTHKAAIQRLKPDKSLQVIRRELYAKATAKILPFRIMCCEAGNSLQPAENQNA